MSTLDILELIQSRVNELTSDFDRLPFHAFNRQARIQEAIWELSKMHSLICERQMRENERRILSVQAKLEHVSGY